MSFGFGFGFTKITAAIRAAFSPSSLFAANEPGVWYDPSDLSTLYQDSAGTTPVTAVEQPVGLILDKSKGLVMGSELITNAADRDFSSDTGFWYKDTGVTISGGTANWANITIAQYGIYKTSFLTAKVYYEITYTITAISSGGLQLYLGGNKGAVRTSAGTYTERLLMGSANTFFIVCTASDASTTASIDNISIKQVTGNHAYQTTATSRPVLSARYNLLTNTETFSGWSLLRGTVSANATTPPAGIASSAAEFFQSSGQTSSAVLFLAGPVFDGSVGFSFYAKANSLSSIGVSESFQGSGSRTSSFDLSAGTVTSTGLGHTASISSVGSGWYRCSIVFTVAGRSGNAEIRHLTTTAGSVYVTGASLVPANQAHLPYQRVNTATDYDTAGFPHYLRFDGVDDWLVTNTITPGTDKAQVFAGVRKLSDAAAYMRIVEYGDVVAGNGSLSVNAPAAAGAASYEVALRGTQTTAFNLSTFAAPITSVLSSAFDIGQTTRETEMLPRVNASTPTLVGTGSANAGTGNFLAYPLYIGRRGGTSLPFNGHLYSLIVRFGSNLPIGTIEKAEKYINTKTRAY